MNGYHEPVVNVINPNLVEITEEPEPYCMSRADVEEAIANVKSNRLKYANNVSYIRRLNFFEDILTLLQTAAQAADKPLPSQIEDLADHG